MARRTSSGISLVLGLLTTFVPALAVGQRASLLLDINPADSDSTPQPDAVRDLQKVGNHLYFRAGDGSEIWGSDGTSAGTENLCPGRCANPEFAGELGPLKLWTAASSTGGRQLWRSDGSRPGTFPLTEPDLQVVGLHASVGRFSYFSGCSGSGGEGDCDLWRTDGTVAGTGLFHEAPLSLVWLTSAGDRLYYLETDFQTASLWVTNGTVAGTIRLRQLAWDPNQEFLRAPAAAGRRLFFLAQDAGGEEVWTSDGTVAGTRRVTSFAADRPFEYHSWLKPAGNRAYFVANDGIRGQELWRTDGTAAGTTRLTDFALEEAFPADGPSIVWEVGGIAVFQAFDDLGSRLWSSRGTLASTAPLPICDGCELESHPNFAVSGGRVFFPLWGRNSSNPQLWVTDGTTAGTRRLRDFCNPGSCSVDRLIPWSKGVVFGLGSSLGEELWISDGTPAGTKPITRAAEVEIVVNLPQVAALGDDLYFLAEGDDSGLWVREAQGAVHPVRTFPQSGATSSPGLLPFPGDRLLFSASNRLWSSAGTPETTGLLSVPDVPWSEAKDFLWAAGVLFFQAGPTYEPHDLWRTDGTPQGTFVVAHLQERAVMAPFQGALYFFDGGWIWKTDGTVQGTVKTGDLPVELTRVEVAATGPNGIYLKTVTGNPGSNEFWFTDGTSAGTRQLTNFGGNGTAGWEPEFVSFGPHVYFSWFSESSAGGFRLWRTDGTAAGTAPLEIIDLSSGGFVTKPTVHQGALYFFSVSQHGLVLWRTDGTVTGTVELGRFPNQDTYYFPLKLTPFAGKLFFNVDDGVHGIELWATDGTPAATALVRDVLPGARSSSPVELTVGGGRLFFSANDLLHGNELWETDGTAAGTRLVQDIGPEAASSDPSQLTVAGDDLFFTADDGITGREVWVLPLSGTAACRPSSTRLCLSGGRYAVEAAWRDFQGNRGPGQARTLTADTGYFWFFDPANVEVVLKVLDGRGVNGHVWTFYGALSNVEYTLTVTDTATGLARRYVNPSGVLASVGDTLAFGPHGASAQAVTESVARPSPLPLVSRRVSAAAATGSCAASSTRLCLNGSRFAVEIAWKDFQGNQGTGKAVELTGDTGWFWFFDPANVEVVLKVLDGTPLNGHHWVFYGALSSVEYTVTVTDTQTGEIRTYRNPAGRLASVADTGAF